MNLPEFLARSLDNNFTSLCMHVSWQKLHGNGAQESAKQSFVRDGSLREFTLQCRASAHSGTHADMLLLPHLYFLLVQVSLLEPMGLLRRTRPH